MSRCLDSQAYMDYSEARQMSFCKFAMEINLTRVAKVDP